MFYRARDVIQRVATGETTTHGTVEVDAYGTVEQCTGKSQSCSTYAHICMRDMYTVWARVWVWLGTTQPQSDPTLRTIKETRWYMHSY